MIASDFQMLQFVCIVTYLNNITGKNLIFEWKGLKTLWNTKIRILIIKRENGVTLFMVLQCVEQDRRNNIIGPRVKQFGKT